MFCTQFTDLAYITLSSYQQTRHPKSDGIADSRRIMQTFHKQPGRLLTTGGLRSFLLPCETGTGSNILIFFNTSSSIFNSTPRIDMARIQSAMTITVYLSHTYVSCRRLVQYTYQGTHADRFSPIHPVTSLNRLGLLVIVFSLPQHHYSCSTHVPGYIGAVMDMDSNNQHW